MKIVTSEEFRDGFAENCFGYCRHSVSEEEGACIYGLYVYEEHRRQGHARKLLYMAITAIRSLGYEYCIDIEALPQEKSISKKTLINFYKSFNLNVLNE